MIKKCFFIENQIFSNSFDRMKKASPDKGPLLFWTCKPGNI